LNEMKTVKRLKIQDWGTILQVSNTSISEQDLRCTVEPIPAHYAAGMYIAE
jgi:hypothetical protein